MSETLQAKRVELILQQLEQLPTLPAVALRVLEVTSDSDASLLEVVKLISSDQSLTTRILHLVHTASVGVPHQITSVERAVVLLGFEAVRSAVLAVSIFETLQEAAPPKSEGASADPNTVSFREEFWKHSVAVSCASEILAEAIVASEGIDAGITPSEAMVCGLLHDMGKVALDAILPKSFAKVVQAVDLLRGNIADLERTVIGLDHMVVGKRLAEQWGLPASLRDVAWLHGQHPHALPAATKHSRLVNLVTLADFLVREQHIGYSGNFTFPIPKEELIAAVGLNPRSVESRMSNLVQRIENRCTGLNLDTPSTNEMYQDAMKRANQELGRVSTQLALKSRRLATRSKFFDALAGMGERLRPDANPNGVLRAIGQTAAGVLEAPQIAAFSMLPGQNFGEAVVIDSQGQVAETQLVDCPRRPRPPSRASAMDDKAPSPVLPAGDDMEWLLLAVGSKLSEGKHSEKGAQPIPAPDGRFWISFEFDGQCIGGVLWAATKDDTLKYAQQAQELTALANGWQLALRMGQLREEARVLSEELAESNRQLQSARTEIDRGRLLISVGEMAAGAAHEVNNPLAVISGRSQLLATQLTDPKLRAVAQVILEQSNRITQIISELMDYAKPAPPEKRGCPVGELLDRAIHEAKTRSDSTDTRIETMLADLPPVAVDQKQVIAALAEVVQNAILAVAPKTGRVEIRAGYDAVSKRVAITVSDNGNGMDDATLKRAFDPFFSAKPAGRRRGLGLAKAQRWIETSGGNIKLESRIGQGTRAIIVLPAVVSDASPSGVKAADRPSVAAGG